MKRAYVSFLVLGGFAALTGCSGADLSADTMGTSAGTGGIDPTDPTDADGSSGDSSGSVISDSAGECVNDLSCPDGEICSSDGGCVAGCSDDRPCEGALSCCDAECVDTLSDAANCGECGDACEGEMACLEGTCGLGECEEGFSDCNGDASDGCEVQGDCSCAPGETQSCYSAGPETQDVGACASGTQTCNDAGSGWSPCEGQVLPGLEACGNMIDDDCDGDVDEDVDADGDGWTTCGGDCCDAVGPDCSTPELVNPGAFEVDGNDVDDDCDGMADNPLDSCDADLASDSLDTLDYARAIDLCQFTDEVPATPQEQVWGVISSELLLADDVGAADPASHSLRDGFGNTTVPQFGDRLAVLSTGHAADSTDTNPGYAPFQTGALLGESSGVPAAWLAANGGNIPNAPGCPDPAAPGAFNPVNMRLRVRAPTNANSFSVQMYFYSAEYPEWVCTPYNDFFITLVDSADPENPADGNIAIYDDGAQTWPVGINLVSAAAGLFADCNNGAIAQCGGGGNYNGCASPLALAGTGFDVVTAGADACVPTVATGGGTGWLTMTGNVEPGEIFEIRFVIWDTSDQLYDSVVLLDDWEWSLEASEPGVSPS